MDCHGLASDHGFLPSNRLEREISKFVDGIEDETGNKSTIFRADDPNMSVIKRHRLATGAKGVMNDARQHYAMFALQQEADKVRQKETNRRLAGGGTKAAVSHVAAVDEEDDDKEDVEFMRYRIQRLQQVQKAAAALACLPTFGHVDAVDALEYPVAVDNVGSDQTFVVVHLMEHYLPASVRLHFKLEAIAAKYDQVKFLSVCAHDAKETLDDDDLPILIVYRAREFFGSESSVGSSFGAALTEEHVEDVLRRMGVRLSTSSAMRMADAMALQRLRELGFSDHQYGDGEEEDELELELEACDV